MMLRLEHFDTKTRSDLEISEEVDSCMAEYLFPEASFRVGHMEADRARPEDLKPYRGHSLQFSSGERLYYSDAPVGELLFPKPSDRSAYGSLPFTPLKSLHSLRQQRVLVIDDVTGDSGGVIADRDWGRSLVGDCWGKISYELAQAITGKTNTPFQFRLGIRPQEGNNAHRIAKGTLAPDPRLNRLGGSVEVMAAPSAARELNLGDYDLILATSMFKGRSGAAAIEPGTHIIDLGLGLKAEASYGQQKLGIQVLVNYPKGVESDVIPELKLRLEKLKQALGQPHLLAGEFIAYYQEKLALRASLDEDSRYLSPLLDALAGDEEPDIKSQEENLYQLLTTDLEHHGQLLEHPYVIAELKSFVRRRWHDLGFSGGVKFKSALAQPGTELGENEVCAPNLPDGVELIVTRSPLVNSNGVILLSNRHLPHLLRTDGCIHIHPDTAERHLQADFDGDRLAFERADKYPALAEEIREKLSPARRYPDVVKRPKVPYQGSFEEIAIGGASNHIGTIANQIMRATAIYNDTLARPQEERLDFVRHAARYYSKLQSDASHGKLELPQHYKEPISQLAALKTKPSLSEKEIEQALGNIRAIQRQVVTDLGNELQVAVDSPKSAARPNMEVFGVCKRAGNCVPVAFLEEKRDKEVYDTRPAAVNTYSPIDRMLREVNGSFEVVNLEHRPAHTFRALHPEPSQWALEVASELRSAYNEKLSRAAQMRSALELDPEKGAPYILFRTLNGEAAAITKLDYFGTFKLDAPALTISIIPKTDDLDLPNSLLVEVEIDGEPKIIGAVSLRDSEEYNLKPTSLPYSTEVSLRPGITESRIEAAWRELDSYVSMLRREHPPPERQELAAALWWQSHTRDDYGNKKALAAFRLFPEEALKPLERLQFRSLSLVGLQYSQHRDLWERASRGEIMTCEIVEAEMASRDGPVTRRGIAVDGQFLAPLQQESPSYTTGTTFKATVHLEPPAKVHATLPDGKQFTGGRSGKAEARRRSWGRSSDTSPILSALKREACTGAREKGKENLLPSAPCPLPSKAEALVTINQVRHFAYSERTFNGDSVKLDLRPIRDGNGHSVRILASLDNLPLGFLARSSEKMLPSLSSIEAKLTSPPSNTAVVRVDPNSLVHPWQRQEPDMEREIARQQLRSIYNDYAKAARVVAPSLPEGEELDREVARLALADGHSHWGVADILSTSPALTQQRPEPGSPGWSAYEHRAKAYIQSICQAAMASERGQEVGM